MLKKLYLHHFRNYTQTEISFSHGVNWITGKNGQGKTNLLEAIYLLCTGRSFRTPQLSQLIEKGAPFFYLEGEIEKEGVNQILKISFDGEAKRVQYNGKTYPYFTPLIGLLPHIFYAPDDISLISGAPSHRRKFLDMHLSQLDPFYLHHLVRYHKALRQRNELLKKKSEEEIDVWEEIMATSASYLMDSREKLILQLQSPLNEYMGRLSNHTDSLSLRYQNSLPEKERLSLLTYWKTNRKKDLHVQTTLSGPHRDDVYFTVRELSAKSFASEGQKHCALAALRLCQWEHLKQKLASFPLMSIDDFGSHLDLERQKNLQEELKGLGQIFLTSPNELPEIFPGKQIFTVESGQVLQVGSS